MNLSNIRTFLHVVESGSFSQAAADMRYAQSTVTSQIQTLEKELGIPLFERIGRKNYLTDVGVAFLQYANDIQYILQKVAAIGQQQEDVDITLRIGVLESLLFNPLLDVISTFKSKYKNVHIFLKVGDTQGLTEMLRQNQLDLIYIMDAINTDISLECHYKKEAPMVFLASAEHELAKEKNIPLLDAMKYPFVVTEPSGNCYNTLKSLAAMAGKKLEYSVMVNSIVAIAILLQDRKSLTFMPQNALNRHLNSDTLAILDVDIPTQGYYSQILIRKSKWVSPVMEYFISIIKQYNREE